MPAKIDPLTFLGKKFSMLTILSDEGIIDKYRLVKAECECESIKSYRYQDIKNLKSTNCGCVRKIGLANRSIKHGMCSHPLYRVWKGMIERCTYLKHVAYHLYGGRGISVCPLWMNDFMIFYKWAIDNGWSKGLQVDRFPDSSGNYSPENCRITTSSQNNRNKSSNRIITYNGKAQCLVEWAEEIRLDQNVLKDRLNKLGWSVEKSFTTPLNAHLC